MKGDAVAPRLRFDRGEISGSLGDLGTFLPLTLGHITQCGLSPAPVFFFAGLWNVATGLLFRLPIPVHALVVPAAEIATVDPEFLSFLNVNTPDEHRRLEKTDNWGRGNP